MPNLIDSQSELKTDTVGVSDCADDAHPGNAHACAWWVRAGADGCDVFREASVDRVHVRGA